MNKLLDETLFEDYSEFDPPVLILDDEWEEKIYEEFRGNHPALGPAINEETFESFEQGSHPILGTSLKELEEREFELIGSDDRKRVFANTAVPFPWICSLDLHFPDPDKPGGKPLLFRGSGTLISPRHVLTAGHCLFDRIKGSNGTKALSEAIGVIFQKDRDSLLIGVF